MKCDHMSHLDTRLTWRWCLDAAQQNGLSSVSLSVEPGLPSDSPQLPNLNIFKVFQRATMGCTCLI